MKIVDTFLVRFNCRERVVDFGPYNAENELLRFSRPLEPFSPGCADIRSVVQYFVHAVQ